MRPVTWWLKHLPSAGLFDPVAIAVGLGMLLTSVAASTVIYREAANGLEVMVRSRLQQTAMMAAEMTDGALHRTLVKPEQKASEAYRRLQKPYLQILKSNPDLIYVYSVVSCGQKLCLVMDAELPRAGETVIPSNVMQVYENPTPILRGAVAANHAAAEKNPYTDEYGTFLSAYAPIPSDGKGPVGVVGVDMSIKQFNAKLAHLRETVLFGLAAALLFSLTVTAVITVLRRKNVRLQKKFRSILSNISAVVFECRLDDGMTLVFVNDYIETLTGYSAGELIENKVRSFASLISDDDRELVRKGIARQIEGSDRFDVECRLMPRIEEKEGGVFPRPVWVRISGTVLKNFPGGHTTVEGYMQNITLRKATEAKIAENEKKYRSLADSMPNLLWITDAYGDTMFYNKTWLDYTGRTLDEEIENGWTNNIHPEDRDACLKKFIDSLATEKPFQCWFRLKRYDGEYRWMLALCTPKFAASGRCDGYIAAATDITDRKAFEARLKRANDHLELFFKHNPAAIAVFDREMRYLMVSERWKADTHVINEELIGRCLYEVIPDLPERWKAEHRRCLAGEIITNSGDRLEQPNGQVDWVAYALHPWYEDGEIMGMIMFSEIITERKQLEDELSSYREDLEAMVARQTEAIRHESEKNLLLRKIITSANEASDVEEALRGCLDEICRYTDWGAGHCYLFDRSGSAVTTTVWSPDADRNQEALKAKVDEDLARAAAGHEPGLDAAEATATLWETQSRINKSASRAKDLKRLGFGGAVCFPIQADGLVLGAFEFFLEEKPDLDPELFQLLGNLGLQFGRLVERFQKEEQLRQAKDEAENSARAKSEFLSNMSHELRTPMHAILNYAGMGIKRLPTLPPDIDTTEKLGKYLGNIQTAGNRLLGLLNNLLDLAKMESGKMSFRREPHDLTQIVSQTRMELDSLMKAKGLNLEIDNKAKNTTAEFDPARLMQVMVNLFSNAIKFSPEGASLTVSIAEDADNLTCALRDRGRGIPEAELDHIFETFVQSSDTKSGAGGTGLGLSISKQIIAAHGGRIWASNADDGGACFTFTLPRPSKAQASGAGKEIQSMRKAG